MVADNCRLSCQLDTLVLLTNRSAKLIRKCCKSGNYGYHFSLCGSLKDDTKPVKKQLFARCMCMECCIEYYHWINCFLS